MNFREKIILIGGGILAFILIGYGWIWLPYQTELITLQKRVVNYQNDLTWMQQAALQFKPSEKNLSTFVQQRLQNMPVKVSQVDNKALQLTFEKMDFAFLIQLLADLHQQYHVSATHITFETNTPETLKGQITLPLDK